MKKFRAGAASFYIVAIATLLFSVIAISFATLVVSEIRRTSDSDLSQSAYDSALAGIEDAKAAYLSYQSCVNQGYTASKNEPVYDGNAATCPEIMYYMEHPDCYMVARILGRTFTEENGIIVQEGNSNNGMEQAYTCTKIKQSLSDYRSTINSTNANRLVKVNFDEGEASDITSIRLSWFSNDDGLSYNFTNFNGNDVYFPLRSSNLSTPPTVSIQLIQTAPRFVLDDFEMTKGSQTNRGTIFLVPSDNLNSARTQKGSYIGSYNGSMNILSEDAFLKSNDKTAENLPYLVYCPQSSNEFACSITIEIPKPIGTSGERNNNTFAFVVSLPYGGPDTDFSIEYCNDADLCRRAEGSSENDANKWLEITSGQIEIDSTGRANDLFRRVVSRIDTYDSNYSYPEYAIQLLGTGTVLTKDLVTICEYSSFSGLGATCQ